MTPWDKYNWNPATGEVAALNRPRAGAVVAVVYGAVVIVHRIIS